MNYEFHPLALAEFQEAALWYEEQRESLGHQFEAAVDTAVKTILNDPERFQPVKNGVRVYRLKRFPYYLFYRISTPALIRILAVMHHRRHPDSWTGRP